MTDTVHERVKVDESGPVWAIELCHTARRNAVDAGKGMPREDRHVVRAVLRHDTTALRWGFGHDHGLLCANWLLTVLLALRNAVGPRVALRRTLGARPPRALRACSLGTMIPATSTFAP